jgi:hypothetical protein
MVSLGGRSGGLLPHKPESDSRVARLDADRLVVGGESLIGPSLQVGNISIEARRLKPVRFTKGSL